MKAINLVFSALAAFLMVFFAQFLLAPNPIAQAWGFVAVVLCAFAMLYMARD